MNFTQRGTILSITEVETLANGAAKLSYRIDTGDQYSPIREFEIYKGADHVEHAHNFAKYNKVGDVVDVEFEIRTREWETKIYTNLSHWKCTKVEGSLSALPADIATGSAEDDLLPF